MSSSWMNWQRGSKPRMPGRGARAAPCGVRGRPEAVAEAQRGDRDGGVAGAKPCTASSARRCRTPAVRGDAALHRSREERRVVALAAVVVGEDLKTTLRTGESGPPQAARMFIVPITFCSCASAGGARVDDRRVSTTVSISAACTIRRSRRGGSRSGRTRCARARASGPRSRRRRSSRPRARTPAPARAGRPSSWRGR